MSNDNKTSGSERLVDGSFESATVGANTWTHQSKVGGWRSDTEVEVWGKGFYGLKATDGNKFAELDYDNRQSNIYQMVQTEAGAEYTFTFDYMKRPDSTAGSDTIQVYWNNTLVGTVDPTKSEWSNAEFKVVGTGGDDRIEFREVGGDNDSYGGLLDNASLIKTGPSKAEQAAAEKAAADKVASDKRNSDDDKHDGRGHGDGDHNDDGHDDNGHGPVKSADKGSEDKDDKHDNDDDEHDGRGHGDGDHNDDGHDDNGHGPVKSADKGSEDKDEKHDNDDEHDGRGHGDGDHNDEGHDDNGHGPVKTGDDHHDHDGGSDVEPQRPADELTLAAVDVAKGQSSEVLVGSDSNEGMSGGVGDDELYGKGGDDELHGDAGGKVTAALEIAVGLVDTDNSEKLSLTISGMPKGAFLSAGTDNGDGSWTLTPDDLKGLTVTADDGANFELTVTAVATDSDGTVMTRSADINVVFDGGNADLVVGGRGNNSLNGDSGDDVVYGGSMPTGAPPSVATAEDNDVVHGNNGNDKVYGNSGDDQVYGDAGNDFVSGGRGNDVVSGGDGNDVVQGNSGDDMITGDAGDDDISGGSGFDTLDFSMSVDGLVVDLSQHSATGMGNDTVQGIEKVLGSALADVMIGDGHDNVFVGNGGDDRLVGAKGNDTFTGGEGSDTFAWSKSDVYNFKGQVGWVDHVTDFQAGDKLELTGFFKAGTTDVSGLVKTTDGQDGTTVSVKFGGEFHDVVVLDGVHDLTANDMMKAGMLLVA